MARAKSARRTDLLEAAQRAMAEHGASVRLNQVAEEAGLTSGAILYHYPDLQDLLIDANRAGMERFYDARVRAIEGLTTRPSAWSSPSPRDCRPTGTTRRCGCSARWVARPRATPSTPPC